MKYFKLDTKSYFEEKNLCLAIGNFDGFHKGHHKIIEILQTISRKDNTKSNWSTGAHETKTRE